MLSNVMLQRVMSRTIMRISEGQIIWALLYGNYSRLCLIRPYQNTNFLYELTAVMN